jgi:subtilisin family serine protease
MSPLDLVNLTPLMERSSGRPEIVVAVIDGPVMMQPCLASDRVRELSRTPSVCSNANSSACKHGTLVAGVLFGKRSSEAPSICPECTMLLRPIFSETTTCRGLQAMVATSGELADAIAESVAAGALVLNMSVGLSETVTGDERKVHDALDYAARRGAIAIAAAGNQGTVGSSTITRHPWVIPVAACDPQGRPSAGSNLGCSIGRWGLSAAGENITSLGTDGNPRAFRGTSAATPFVTGAAALLWSEFPDASANEVKMALVQSGRSRRNTIVPPLLNAWGAYQTLASARGRRRN